jgi:hypothetical protein
MTAERQNGEMDSVEVMRWVARYEQAWRTGDVGAVDGLFTEAAEYRQSPYAEARVGHAAIKAFWRDDDVFAMTASPVAVDDRDAVVRVEVQYGDPVRQEYRVLWVLRFSKDGRVEGFEEWAYWPGKPFAASVPSG